MKKPIFMLLSAAFIATLSYLAYSQQWFAGGKNDHAYHEEEGEEENEKQSGAARQLSSWYQAKAYPEPGNLSSKYQAAWQEYLDIKENTRKLFTIDKARVNGLVSNWAQLGYCTNGGTRIGGRIVCMAIDPNNTDNLWVGSASGGIWRSVNAGTNWAYVPTNLPVLGVSSILVDPSNSNTIYAGTGEVYHTEVSVMGYNVWKTRGTYGIGIIKSTDGGTTWTQVMPKASSDLFAIQSMAFLPGNSATLFACATDGLYRSTNSGGSWTKIYTGVNVRDIAIDPSNTNVMVLSVGNMTNATKGIFRTTNGSNASPTWTQITTGLPASYQGHIKLDNVGSAVLVASIGISSGSSNEIYRSANFGSSWTVQSTTNHCSYQFWFAHTVGVNPFSTDSIIYGGVGIYRQSTGSTRGTISGLHADHHDVKFDPVRRGTVYVCNDGGVYKSTNGGGSFTAINTGLNATQFYASLGVSKTSANLMVGGLQDNGQVVYNGTNWVTPTGGGGDGTACAVHPSNNSIVLACRDARAIKRSTDGGTSFSELTSSYWGFVGDSRTAFVAPIAFAPSNGNIVYQLSDNIHISNNAGASFSNNGLGAAPPYPATTPNAFIEQQHKTGLALAVSPTNPNKIYVSTSPFAQADNDVNTIYVNGQPNVLKTSTPATTPYTSIKGTLPDRFVTDFAISQYNDDSVYVVLGGFGTSHVYLSPNGGTTWLSRGTGLPDVPFNAILIDPVNPSIIYAACDFGVYVSHNKGQNWYDYNTGFYDATMVYDLQIDANNKLIAATHGKGVFRSDLFTPSPTLPVEFTSFRGENRNTVNALTWNVDQEVDLSRYEVERSSDGFSYQRVGTVTARNIFTPSTYYYNDHIAGLAYPSFYYRLKAINLDGSYFYSDVVQIRISGRNVFKVTENPFREQLSFRFMANEAGKMNIRLLDVQGRVLRKEDRAIVAGTAYYTMSNLSVLPAGTYVLEVWTGDKNRYTEKIVKY